MRTREEIDRLADAEVRLALFLAEQVKNSTTYFGYPEVPENNDLSILGISGLAKLHLNNAGDPWVQGNSRMHTKDFEKEALDFAADLYGIKNNYWGYITSGGTEGNLYGAYAAREFLKKENSKTHLIFSEETHYSVPKNAYLLSLNPIRVKSLNSGEIDYNELLNTLDSYDKDDSFIYNLNLGTTMKGAHDNLLSVVKIFNKLGIQNYYIHADAALSGFIYPFTESYIDLFQNGVNSISISGHKFPGAIHPCGIVLIKKNIHNRSFGENWVPYVGTKDSTISGSRNGFLALNLWYLFEKKGLQGFKNEAVACISNARYLTSKLVELNIENISMFPNQNIVVFQKPNDLIIKKYQLATQDNLAHIVVMQHITKNRIDIFCDDLKESLNDQ